jgi:hypothetical protein
LLGREQRFSKIILLSDIFDWVFFEELQVFRRDKHDRDNYIEKDSLNEGMENLHGNGELGCLLDILN